MCQPMLPPGSDPVRTVISAADTAAMAAAARERVRSADIRAVGAAAAEAERTMRAVRAAAFAGIAAHPEMGGDDRNLIESLCGRTSADAGLVRMLADHP